MLVRRLIESNVDKYAPDLIVLPEYLGFFRAAAGVRTRFANALPLRVEESGSTLGASATLTGKFAGLIWEGLSFVVNAKGRRIAESSSPRGASVLIIDLGPDISFTVLMASSPRNWAQRKPHKGGLRHYPCKL